MNDPLPAADAIVLGELARASQEPWWPWWAARQHLRVCVRDWETQMRGWWARSSPYERLLASLMAGSILSLIMEVIKGCLGNG